MPVVSDLQGAFILAFFDDPTAGSRYDLTEPADPRRGRR